MNAYAPCAESSHNRLELVDQYRSLVRPLIEHAKMHTETQGICYLGGVAKGGKRTGVDEHSDIDLALFISTAELDEQCRTGSWADIVQRVQPSLPRWLPNFKFVCPAHRAGIQVNVHQLLIGYEERDDVVWDSEKREAFSQTCETIYDPFGRVGTLIRRKSRIPDGYLTQRITHFVASFPVTMEHSILKAAYRGNYLDAQMVIYRLATELVETLYHLNHTDPPHWKRRFGTLATLSYLPPQALGTVKTCLSKPAKSLNIVRARVRALRKVYDTIIRDIPRLQLDIPPDPYSTCVTKYRPGWQLRLQTAADQRLPRKIVSQADKMKIAQWNSDNFRLVASSNN